MNPGQIYKFTIDLWSTSNVFLQGPHAAAGSFQQQFPALRPQSEYRRDPAPRENYVSATNTIYHDAEHPSALVLPIVPVQ